ncbi:MTH938/NDUFAF3 family protein [Burkholderiales bacterium]|jgi:uncharacterized protein|nr:MTH938/NDUFAF3 family protein [Burkholderiales bacterium]
MKIAVQSGLDIVKITEVTSHYVELDETRINYPFLVGTDNAVTDWVVTNKSIGADAIQNLPTKGYELLLIGTGDKFTTLTPDITRLLSRLLPYEVMTTVSACRTFNIVAGEGRKVLLAALIGSDN